MEKSHNNFTTENKGFLNMSEKDLQKVIDEPIEKEPLWKEAIVDFSIVPEKPPTILKINGLRFGSIGNISMITGKAKSKKTFLTSAITSSAISEKNVLGFSSSIKGQKSKILYYDTEQSIYDIHNVTNRILKLSELNTLPENFIVFSIKKYSTTERLKIIEDSIDNNEDISLVIIDGVRDICHDFNDPKESSNLISKLMKWTVDKEMHIMVVLHQNKGNEFARGHLGSELINKCETVVSVTNDKKKDIVTVDPQEMRGKEFDQFAFRIDSEVLPRLCNVPEKSENRKPKIEPKIFTDDQHIKVLKEVFSKTKSFTQNTLIPTLKLVWSNNNISIGYSKLREFIPYYIQKEFIINKGSDLRKNFILNEKYYSDGMLC